MAKAVQVQVLFAAARVARNCNPFLFNLNFQKSVIIFLVNKKSGDNYGLRTFHT